MSHCELNIEVEPRCLSLWKQSWAKRFARVTLFVFFSNEFVIVKDTSNGFWFLPGGGVEQNESIEEASKREATEELGIEIQVNRIVKTFHVNLISRESRRRLKIPPFIIVHATCAGGQLKTEYAPKRKLFLIRKDECRNLLQDFTIPKEYQCMKPYLYISQETIREFFMTLQSSKG